MHARSSVCVCVCACTGAMCRTLGVLKSQSVRQEETLHGDELSGEIEGAVVKLMPLKMFAGK